jgi:hypothetical protein
LFPIINKQAFILANISGIQKNKKIKVNRKQSSFFSLNIKYGGKMSSSDEDYSQSQDESHAQQRQRSTGNSKKARYKHFHPIVYKA